MSFLKKLLNVPSPSDLGHGQPLSMRDISSKGEYTYEDYLEEIQAKYPLRFFLRYTASNWVEDQVRDIKDTWYWVKCHIYPRFRFHKLDLRNPGPGIEYTHGWIDRSEQVLWANFVILRNFVEREKPVDPAKGMPEEMVDEIERDVWTRAKKTHDEIMSLYDWWMVQRPKEEREEQELSREFIETTNETKREELGRRLLAYHEMRPLKDDEMLHRLMGIRGYLWT